MPLRQEARAIELSLAGYQDGRMPLPAGVAQQRHSVTPQNPAGLPEQRLHGHLLVSQVIATQ